LISLASESPKLPDAAGVAFAAALGVGRTSGVVIGEVMDPIGSATAYFPKSRDF
jgi:hypothetical protein